MPEPTKLALLKVPLPNNSGIVSETAHLQMPAKVFLSLVLYVRAVVI